MGLSVTERISAITVLIQGFLSFFSPCVLPLLPLYIGYLSGGTLSAGSEDEKRFDRKKVLLNTVCFVIGISFSFFLLGLGMRAVGRFFSGHQMIFSRIGGILVVLFGLYQLGTFGASSFLMREKRLPVKVDKMAMSPLTALIMGFVFSFAWTPCVGPTLSGVLLMAASAKSSAAGFVLVGVYTAGFVIPFLLTGFFTTSVLSFFKSHKNVVKYTEKISGALLILMGILMITGHMNGITGYLSGISQTAQTAQTADSEVVQTNDTGEDEQISHDEMGSGDPSSQNDIDSNDDPKDVNDPSSDDTTGTSDDSVPKIPAPDFVLTDQYGETHSLSDYRGKIIFLNFWATWCPPCRAEMPDIQALYEDNSLDPESDLVILAVAFPNHSGETDEEGVKAFLEANGYTYPTLMDSEASLANPYYITAFPTTYMIDPEGNIFGYVAGSISREVMDDIVKQTRDGWR